MIRNEKGQFVSENKNEVTEEKKNVEVIDYDAEIKATEAKLEELKKAQVAKIEEEKRTAALARKVPSNLAASIKNEFSYIEALIYLIAQY